MKPRSNVITIFVVTALVTMFGQTDTAKSQVVTDGLLSYWTFDAADIDGQTVKDAWGNRHGAIIGNTRVTVGIIGDALQFDGSGDYVEYDDSGLPEGNAPRTMSVWVKPEGAGVRAALEWGTSAGTQRCSILVLAAEKIKFCGQNADVISNGSVVNGEWHYVSETYDGTNIRIYIDGVLDKEQAVSINTVLNVGRIGANVRVGEFYNGAIDEVSIYDRALSADEVAQNFAAEKGLSSGGIADVIYPEDGAVDVPRETILSWKPGEFAATHDVYFGTVFGDVNDADRNNSLGVLAGHDQIAATYLPGRLDLGQTYYWRIDEVNTPPDGTIYKGDVWSFTAEPVGYPIDGANITATASSSMAGSAPEKTIDGSGLDDGDLHSKSPEDMWLSDMFGTQPTWIEYQFDKVYKLHEMSVWNQNQIIEPSIGYGFKDVTIEYSVDGVTYTTLGTTHEFARGPGADGYAANTNVDFGGAVAKYVKLTVNSGWESILTQYGLSEVRFLYVPVWAREPNPATGATDVSVSAVLDWRAGREAAGHDVYLSTDEQAVTDGTAPVVTVTEPSYGSSLDVASTYYWRITEVNDTETPATWQGDVWNLSTQEYLVVEDFESYNDIPADQEGSNLVYVAWVDGFDNPSANGSTMGYVTGASLESGNVHDGRKSVPLTYNNTTATYSEVTANLADLQVTQDWTKHGIKALTLRFFGDPTNVAQQMYVKLNGTKIAYDGSAENTRLAGWQMWYIDLASIGLDLSHITELGIGFERIGALGGQGMVLLDAIRLYSYDRQLITPVDPGAVGLQAHYEFEGNTNDSSGNARHGTSHPMFVPGKTGQAIAFNGIDQYVTITGYKGILADASGVQQPFTVAAWIKTTDDGDRTIASWGTNSNQLRVDFRLYQGRLRVEHGAGNVQGDTTLNDDEWHHVALTVSQGATISYPEVQLWLDGMDNTRDSTDPEAFSIAADVDMAIGYRATAAARYFFGVIDEVRIYDRALAQEEITWLAGRTEPFDKQF